MNYISIIKNNEEKILDIFKKIHSKKSNLSFLNFDLIEIDIEENFKIKYHIKDILALMIIKKDNISYSCIFSKEDEIEINTYINSLNRKFKLKNLL